MATNGYSSGPKAEEARRSDDTVVANERKDAEKAESGGSNLQYSQSDDPFGDESNSEVKYKVLEWW